ncbi:AzlD domain-containing protein [Parapusillimonas granuli]|uniref:AzlD domain-containing protein n=1 Tax=Parapusillimonas granuli TaxID=380911 RepID=A0A853FWQ3_9BURK|nr:AzlD domain-containing protein [Parapusillimonas granuli]MBB5214083.1 branched-subunit amino acid transport protein [Parapusillimonas granuli]NYT50504.1 AzlD domain-containing protein [Parapusillimonas granuli]
MLTQAELIWVVALSGAGTLLVRWLPMVWQHRNAGRRPNPRLRRALDAIGPSAIVALLAASFWGMAAPQPSAAAVLPILCGLAGVALGKRALRSIAWATLSGVLAYGLAVWALAGLSL